MDEDFGVIFFIPISIVLLLIGIPVLGALGLLNNIYESFVNNSGNILTITIIASSIFAVITAIISKNILVGLMFAFPASHIAFYLIHNAEKFAGNEHGLAVLGALIAFIAYVVFALINICVTLLASLAISIEARQKKDFFDSTLYGLYNIVVALVGWAANGVIFLFFG